MRNIGTIIACLCLVSTSVFAQKARTYLGKGNLLELNYQGYLPVITSNDFYEMGDNQLQPGKNKKRSIHNGLQLMFTRHIYKRLSLGVEFSTQRIYYVHSESSIIGSSGYYEDFISVPMNVRVNSYIGKIEFGSREGIFPIGINHQIGFGLITAGLQEKRGEVKMVSYQSSFQKNYETSWDYISGFTLFYDLNFRIPLSDRLMFNVGMRYNANWFRTPAFSSIGANDIDPYFFKKEMNETFSWNLIRLHTGLGFSF